MCDERIMFDMISGENFSDTSILSVFRDLAPSFDETFSSCKLFHKWSTCAEMFYPIITEEGICYVFNALNINEVATDE